MSEKIYQLNDRTMKYQTLKQCRRQHYYLGLPGEFEARFPQEIVFPNMDSGRVDEYYSTKEGLLINIEEESDEITDKTRAKYGKYAIFAEYTYSKKYYLAVICHKDPKRKSELFKKSPSVYIKIHYYYFADEELWEKYENVINKVKENNILTDNEALDIAFIPKFISKKHKQFMTESLAKTFKNAIINDKELKRDVAAILGAMILKNIKNTNKINELMEDIGMRQVEEEIKILARDEYGEELKAIEEENQQLKQENTKYKNKIEELRKIGNLESAKAKEIINSLLLL
ncbi:hypothetical protein [Methanobrevibacter sp.]